MSKAHVRNTVKQWYKDYWSTLDISTLVAKVVTDESGTKLVLEKTGTIVGSGNIVPTERTMTLIKALEQLLQWEPLDPGVVNFSIYGLEMNFTSEAA